MKNKSVCLCLLLCLVSVRLWAEGPTGQELTISHGSYEDMDYSVKISGHVCKVGDNYYYVPANSDYSFSFMKNEDNSILNSKFILHASVNSTGYGVDWNASNTAYSGNCRGSSTMSFDVERYHFAQGTKCVAAGKITTIVDSTAPSISGAPPSYSNAASITLSPSATDGESGMYGSVLCYVDGIETKTISTPGKHSVQYVAFDNVGNKAIQNYTVILDRASPTLSVSRTPGDFWTNGSVTVSASASDDLSGVDGSSYSYRLDGGSPIQGASSALVSDEGRHTMTWSVKDLAGNEGSASTSFGIDKTGPTVALSRSPSGWTNDGVVVNASVSDGLSGPQMDSIEYCVDSADGGWTKGASAKVDREGSHTVYFRAQDVVGNQTSASLVITGVDKTLPTVRVERTPSAGWSNTPVRLNAYADDNSGGSGINAATWQCRLDSANWESGSQLSVTTEGSHTASFRVSDNAGNESVASVSLSCIDSTPPAIALSKTPNTAWSNGPIKVSATASDPLSGVDETQWRHRIDGGGWLAGNEAVVLTEGAHSIEFTVVDLVGNSSSASTTVSTIDLTAPSVTLSKTPAEAWTREGVVVAASVSDSLSGADQTSLQYCVDSDAGPWTTATSTKIASEGSHIVFFRAFDRAGNTGMAFVQVANVDKTAPKVTVARTPDSDWSNRDYLFTVTAKDGASGLAPAGVQASVNAGPWATVADSAVTVSEEGNCAVAFTATDAVGNTSTPVESRGIIDRVAPVISSLKVLSSDGNKSYPDDGGFIGESDLSVKVESSDTYLDRALVKEGKVASIAYILAATPSTDFAGAKEVLLTDLIHLSNIQSGLWYLSLRARDAAGNEGAVTSRLLRIDTSLPSAPLIESSTHRKAASPEIADPSSLAIFKITSRSNSLSGSAAVSYSLRKGLNGSPITGEEALGPDASATVSFENLADNDAGEYYYFQAKTISGSGIEGETTEYRFRVDTTPPEGLVVRCSPQIDSEIWYSSKTAKASWEKPRDMSGIKRYYYLTSLTPPQVPDGNQERAAFDLSAWTSTDATSFSVDLSSFLASQPDISLLAKSAGVLYLSVCAEDFAGLRFFSSRALRYDFSAPVLLSLSGSTESFRLEKAGDQLSLRWGQAKDAPDGASGISRIAIKTGRGSISTGETSGQPRQTLTVNFDGPSAVLATDDLIGAGAWTMPAVIDVTATYVAMATIYDGAGNSTTYTALIKGDGTAQPADTLTLSLPYSCELAGYSVVGEKNTVGGTTSFVSASASLPTFLAIQIKSASALGEKIKTLSFSSLQGDPLGLSHLETGALAEGSSYAIGVGDWAFDAPTIALDRDQGLQLIGATYEAKDKDGNRRSLSFPRLALGSPSELVPVGSSVSIDPSLTLAGTSQEANPLVVIAHGAALADFGSGRLRFTRGSSGEFGIKDSETALSIVHMVDGKASELIPLRSFDIDSKGHLVAARLEADPSSTAQDGSILKLGEDSYLLHSAEILPDSDGALKLHVYESELLLPSGSNPATATVRDFIVDLRTNTAVKGPSFSVSSFTITYSDGSVFTANTDAGDRISFTSQGSLRFAGSLKWSGASGDTTLNLSNVSLSDEGGSGAAIGAFTVFYNGYRLDIQEAHKASMGIIADMALISLGQTQALVRGLGLSFPGGVASLTAPSETAQNPALSMASGYGNIGLTSLLINSAGVFGSFQLRVPEAVFGGPTMLFQRVPIAKDGAVGASAALSTSRQLSMGGYQAAGKDIYFDGTLVRVPTATIENAPGFSESSLDQARGLSRRWSWSMARGRKTAMRRPDPTSPSAIWPGGWLGAAWPSCAMRSGPRNT